MPSFKELTFSQTTKAAVFKITLSRIAPVHHQRALSLKAFSFGEPPFNSIFISNFKSKIYWVYFFWF